MVDFTKDAVTDIREILESSNRLFGQQQTEKYLQSLEHCFELLDSNPELGLKADHIIPGLRKHLHRSHAIFYKIKNEKILIIRMLHKKMDIPRSGLI